MGNGITHLNLGSILDTRDDITYLTSTQFLARNHIHLQYTDFISIIFHAGIEELHLISLTDYTILYLEVGDDSAEGVKYRVENQCLERCLLVSYRSRNTINDSFQYFFYTLTGLTRSTEDILMLATDQVYNFVFYLFRHSRRHIYLIDYRDNLQVVLDSHIEV